MKNRLNLFLKITHQTSDCDDPVLVGTNEKFQILFMKNSWTTCFEAQGHLDLFNDSLLLQAMFPKGKGINPDLPFY